MDDQNSGSRPVSEVEIKVAQFDSMSTGPADLSSAKRLSKQNSSREPGAVPIGSSVASKLESPRSNDGASEHTAVPANILSTSASGKLKNVESKRLSIGTNRISTMQSQHTLKTELPASKKKSPRMSAEASEVTAPARVSAPAPVPAPAPAPTPARAPCPKPRISENKDGGSGGKGDGNDTATCAAIRDRPAAADDNCFKDEPDESACERIIGLTEMFPTSIQTKVNQTLTGAAVGIKKFYHFSCNACWAFFTTSAILFLPILLESERSRINETLKCQHKKILLGPCAGIDSGSPSPSLPTIQH